jgi:hypothetical protein
MTMAFGGSLRFRWAEEKSELAEIEIRGAWGAEILRPYKIRCTGKRLGTACIRTPPS